MAEWYFLLRMPSPHPSHFWLQLLIPLRQCSKRLRRRNLLCRCPSDVVAIFGMLVSIVQVYQSVWSGIQLVNLRQPRGALSVGRLGSLKWHLFLLHQMNHASTVKSSTLLSSCPILQIRSVTVAGLWGICRSLLKSVPQLVWIISHSHRAWSVVSSWGA